MGTIDLAAKNTTGTENKTDENGGSIAKAIKCDTTKCSSVAKEELKLATGTLDAFVYWRDGIPVAEMVFWIVIFIAGIIISIVVSVKLVRAYLEQPTATSVIVTELKEIEFPRITLCLLYRFSKKKAKSIGISSRREIEYLHASFISGYSYNRIDGNYYRKNVLIPEITRKMDKIINASNLSFIEFLEMLAPSCEEIMLACYFGHEKMNCCNATRMFLSHNGPCLEFNWVRYLRQKISGAVGGLYLRLKYDLEETTDTQVNNYRYSAIQVYTNPAAAVLERDPCLARIGEFTSIQMAATWFHNIPLNQPCLERTEETAATFQSLLFYRYGKRKCEYQCMVEFIYGKCGCIGVNTFGKDPNRYPFCRGAQAVDCGDKWTNGYDPSNCSKLLECRVACNYWRYFPSATSVPLRDSLSTFYDNETDSETNDSITEISIYYPGLRRTVVKEFVTDSVFELVSHIGGDMGLWTGASLVTVVHFIFFCIRFIGRHIYGNQLPANTTNENDGGDRAMVHSL